MAIFYCFSLSRAIDSFAVGTGLGVSLQGKHTFNPSGPAADITTAADALARCTARSSETMIDFIKQAHFRLSYGCTLTTNAISVSENGRV